jgi:WD40 repeat protein/LysM repeat protein
MKDQTITTTTGEQLLTGTEGQTAEGRRQKVFLSWTTDDIAENRETLLVMLEKAGLEVFPTEARPTDEATYRKQVDTMIGQADFAVHLLGGELGDTLREDAATSWAKYAYERSVSKSKSTQGAFKRIVWAVPLEGLILQGEQQDFIVQVQNGLTPEVMFSTVSNPAQFIDEARAFLETEAAAKEPPKEYDIAFISNVNDAADCYEVIEQLEQGSKLKLTTLTVVPENEADYKAQGADMVRRSKLAVVFFKDAGDWGISYVKQVWKYIGGASANTPFLLIGEDEPRRNRFLHFRAPNVRLEVVEHSQILARILEVQEILQKTGKISDTRFSPYTGLRPFNEDESIFFKGREKHVDFIVDMLQRQNFTMVTGSSGDGKSSLIFAGVVPSLKGGFMRTQFSKWAVADFRPERQPLRNMANAVAKELRYKNPDDVENALSYGFSALVDLYKKSPIYCDVTSDEWLNASEEDRKQMRRKAANLLILVDQFEEFFTNQENYRDGVASPLAQIAVNVLVETVRIAREESIPIYVVCTMRSDYIGQCVAFRGFAELIGLSTYYVPRLKREEIQEVIQAPAHLNGDKLSLRLAQRLLNDVGDGIDQLPVLQHCLHQMWTDADLGRQEIDVINYARVGGLQGFKLPKEVQADYQHFYEALPEEKKVFYEKPRLRNILNRHANELLETADEYYNARYSPPITKETAQSIIRTAFSCLTRIDENRAVRNRMTLQQITDIYGKEGVDSQVVGHVMNIFREQGNTFVQPYITDDIESKELSPSTTLDITHESLIRNWERLVDWAETENKSVSTYSEFKVQVNQWLSNDCEPRYLLSEGNYAYYNNWYQTQQPTPAWIRRYIRPDEIVPELDPMEQSAMYLEDVDDFLGESKGKIEARKRTRTIVIIGLIVALVIMALLALNAQLEKDKADEARIQAVANAELAKEAAIKAKIAADKADLESIRAKRAKYAAEISAIEAENAKAVAAGEAANAKQQAILAELRRKDAELATAEAKKQASIALQEKQAADIAKEAALKAEANAKREREAAIKARNDALITQSLFLAKLAEEQSEAGKEETGVLLALQALPKTIGAEGERPFVDEAEAALYFSLNKIVNRKPLSQMDGHTNKMIFNQFTPDSKQLISTSWDMTARVWDVATGREIEKLEGHSHIVDRAQFSADMKYTLTMGEDFSARLWDFKSGRSLYTFKGHKDLLTHSTISADGRYVLTASRDATVRLWSTQNGRSIAVIPTSGPVLYVAFSPDARRMAYGTEAGVVEVYNIEEGKTQATLNGHTGSVPFLVFSHDGNTLATVSSDRTARTWDARTGAQKQVLKGHQAGLLYASFAYDDNRLVTASQDSSARVWSLETGREVGLLSGKTGHKANVYNVQFSSDNQHIVTTGADSTIRLWDANSYLRLAVYNQHPGNGYYATFSPNSKYLACAYQEGNAYSVRVFRILPNQQSLITLADSGRKRSLTGPELQEFFIKYDKVPRTFKQQLQQQYEQRREKIEGSSAAPAPASPLILDRPAAAVPAPVTESVAPKATAPAAPVRSAVPPPAPGARHRVATGETLWAISQQYGVPVDQLRLLNKLRSDDIKVGQVLMIRAEQP